MTGSLVIAKPSLLLILRLLLHERQVLSRTDSALTFKLLSSVSDRFLNVFDINGLLTKSTLCISELSLYPGQLRFRFGQVGLDSAKLSTRVGQCVVDCPLPAFELVELAHLQIEQHRLLVHAPTLRLEHSPSFLLQLLMCRTESQSASSHRSRLHLLGLPWPPPCRFAFP